MSTDNSPRRPVRLVDTSLRDGNQSLWGATGLTTGMVERVGPVLERAGFHALDFTSSTHLSVGVRWHRESPWERIERMRAVVPTTPLSLIGTGMRFMSWDRSPQAVMRLSFRLLAKHGMRRFQIAEPMNDTASALAIARMAKEEGIEQVIGAVTFTESPVHTDDVYHRAAERLAASSDIDAVYIKDPGGLLTVERIETLLPSVRSAVGDRTLELHSHCTTGVAPQVYVRAAELGVDVLHTAIGVLANGTSQPSAERLVANLDALGIPVTVDRDALAEAADLLAAIAESQGLKPGLPVEYDVSYHIHQVPGGMMGTLRRQLGEIGMTDALPQLLEEVATVRAELGYPIMVTPYSQFVGSQALMNVLALRSGQERYSRLPDEIIRFVLGHFGTPPGPVADLVRERVDAAPRTRELDRPVDEPTLDDLHSKISGQLGRDVSEDELLLRLVLPADQLEAMYTAGPAPTWDTTPPVRTPLDFVSAVRALPNWRSLSVTRGTTSIHLVRDDGPTGPAAKEGTQR